MANDRRKSLRDELGSRDLYGDAHGKAEEQAIIEGFLTRLSLSGYNLYLSERPDFKISFRSDGLVVGCELTLFNNDVQSPQLQTGSPERRFHSQWKRFARELRSHLDEQGGHPPYLYGSVFFKTPTLELFDHLNRDRLLDEIVNLVKGNPMTGTVDTFDAYSYPLLSEFVHHLCLYNTYPETGILWWCAHLQTGEVKDPNEALVRIIREKSAKAIGYNWGAADEKWLIIYARASGLSDMAQVRSDPTVSKIVRNIPFTHIFLWDKFSEDVLEVYPLFRPVLADGRTLYVNRIPKSAKPYLIRRNDEA
ncbi:MAG: hypothetical protein HY675_14560 [Chloroflexi bacterium]|nr:hypothetical protein [Chloroflexota bacterium]